MNNKIPEYMLDMASEFFRTRMGLRYSKENYHDMGKRIQEASAGLNYTSPKDFINSLFAGEHDESGINIIARYFTIGETYFFREKNTFDVLRNFVIPEIMQSGHGFRRINVWSAGCSSGEEPYSIAILLKQLIPAYKEWNIKILATDINDQVLSKAAKGVYTNWSFRHTDEEFRKKYFTRLGENMYEINQDIKEMVEFRLLNLAKDPYPSYSFDIVMCRNVLIYFDEESKKNIISGFHSTLTEKGWFIVSNTELSHLAYRGFKQAIFPGTILYRKTPYATHLPVKDPVYNKPDSTVTKELTVEVKREQREPKAAGAPVENDLFVKAKEFANEGKLEAALDTVVHGITENKTEHRLYYLQAAILQELGRTKDAEDNLRKAIFLNPDFPMAYFLLGNILLANNKKEDAKRIYLNSYNQLQKHPVNEPLEESEGLTAGRLSEIISVILKENY